jgi:hypothetical protein
MQYLSTHPLGAQRVEVLRRLSNENAAPHAPLFPDYDWKRIKLACDSQ